MIKEKIIQNVPGKNQTCALIACSLPTKGMTTGVWGITVMIGDSQEKRRGFSHILGGESLHPGFSGFRL